MKAKNESLKILVMRATETVLTRHEANMVPLDVLTEEIADEVLLAVEIHRRERRGNGPTAYEDRLAELKTERDEALAELDRVKKHTAQANETLSDSLVAVTRKWDEAVQAKSLIVRAHNEYVMTLIRERDKAQSQRDEGWKKRDEYLLQLHAVTSLYELVRRHVLCWKCRRKTPLLHDVVTIEQATQRHSAVIQAAQEFRSAKGTEYNAKDLLRQLIAAVDDLERK